MTRHERLLENYEDAYFALLMEDVAQVEGARLDQLNMELQNDPHTAVPEELTKRCLRTINPPYFWNYIPLILIVFDAMISALYLLEMTNSNLNTISSS